MKSASPRSPEEQLLLLRRLDYLRAEERLSYFVRAAWKVLEPDVELKWGWHHDLLCEYLEAAELGQIRRLIFNVCPRSTKSTITSVCFPTWVWLKRPSERTLFGSYADDLAVKHSVLRRNLIESPWYQTGYGSRFSLSSDVNTKGHFTNDKTGQMKAAGIRGSVTGEGGGYVMIDDPHNPKGAESELERASTIQNFDLAWSSRLNDKKTGRIILVMQRLREDDLTGHLLEKGGYTHVKVPSIAEERERIVFPVTGRVVEREAGDLMHPERDGVEELKQAKLDLGDYGFAGQHQQAPSPSGGGLFTDGMFEYVDRPAGFDYTFVTGDTAYKEKQENDFTVFSAWGVKDGQLYLIGVWRRQIKAANIEAEAAPFILRFQQWGFRGAWIEPKGHGIYLNQKFPLPPHHIMVPSEEDLEEFFKDRKYDKVMRASIAVPWLANRKVKICNDVEDPVSKTDKEYLVREATGFPKGKRDDFVDTLVDAIKVAFGKPLSILDVS